MSAEIKPKVKPVCAHCGSSEIHADACAHWDTDKQEWMLVTTHDNTDCEQCQCECRINWVQL